jgi:uncharacterized damage-inducible protein DinB
MTIQDYIKAQISITHYWGEGGVLQTLIEEQFNWVPPGAANTIAATALHIFGIEDSFIQGKLLNRPRLWESEGWAAKIGVDGIPDLGNQWTNVKGKQLPKDAILAYGQAVQAATQAYLAALTPEELAKPVQMGPKMGTAAELLSILVIHTTIHAGEISALMGIQGLQGQPV